MRELIANFSLPWWIIGFFWLFLGGILFNKIFHNEVDIFLAHMMGLKKRSKKDENEE